MIVLTTALTITGLIVVYSASFVISLARFGDPNYYIIRQLIWAVVGTTLLVAASKTDYHRWKPIALPLMVATLAALVAVLVMGIEGGGAQRWIGFGPVTLQPAEFAKFTATIYLAAWLASKGDELRTWEGGLLPFLIIIGSMSFLIMLQPNLGTTLIILVITLTMFWVAGASWQQIVGLGTTGVVVLGLLATVAGYRVDRLQAYFHAEDDPTGKGFQTLQSLIAIGNGGIHGLGLGASRGKFFYIPESHTDGVFAIVGEELGIVATVAIILMYVLLMVRGYQVAQRATDDFGRLIATGVTTWVTAQALLNIGGITRVIPLTGVPLPFLSFGSNALASIMLAMGVLISVSKYSNQPEPEPEPPLRDGWPSRRRV